ncbi:MAG: MarR family winged helix-turn-helix transcriptional regulator [Firmicutes bacterium]|nr:MarR family winged helix-turn-helix transcriptional regulator [Bacillota bacterium]MCL2255908.1 MarR family winged helix-turn-helix transcriptional regulator [Bacillota bacterium]
MIESEMDNKRLKELITLLNDYTSIFNRNVAMPRSGHNALLKKNGLTSLELQVLIMISHFEKTSPSAIADELGIPRPNATRLVRSLSEKGFCKKEKDSGKTVSLTLSEKGREFIENDKSLDQEKRLKIYNKHIPEEKQERLFELYNELIEIWSMLP